MNKVTDNILYIGVDDTETELFENQYPIEEGISYNSYVIMDEKITIMDTVDARTTDAWLANLREALGDKKPAYLVVQHLEPDHSGNVETLAKMYPEMQIVGSVKTGQMLPQFFDTDVSDRFIGVKEGDTLELGSHTLTFVMAPMVHWPEAMVSYESSEKVLFSADAFGTFGALKNNVPWIKDATHYYFNIVGKYGSSVQTLLKKAAGLDISIICALHGPVLKEDLGYYIEKYDKWSKYEPEEKGIFIAYACPHGHTALAAEEFANELRDAGENVDTCDLTVEDVSEAVEKCFMYDRIVLAAASYDAALFPPMEDLLYHLEIKNFQKRKFALIENGSWAPTAGKCMRAHLEKLKDCEICDTLVSLRTRRTAANDADFAAMKEWLLK